MSNLFHWVLDCIVTITIMVMLLVLIHFLFLYEPVEVEPTPTVDTCYLVQVIWGGEFKTPSNKLAGDFIKRGHKVVDVPCKPIYNQHSH